MLWNLCYLPEAVLSVPYAISQGWVEGGDIQQTCCKPAANLPESPDSPLRSLRESLFRKRLRRSWGACNPNGIVSKYSCTVFACAIVVPSCHCQMFGVNPE